MRNNTRVWWRYRTEIPTVYLLSGETTSTVSIYYMYIEQQQPKEIIKYSASMGFASKCQSDLLFYFGFNQQANIYQGCYSAGGKSYHAKIQQQLIHGTTYSSL